MGHRNPVIEIVEMSALYRTTQQPFNATHHASIIVGRQGKGVAGASGATGPADAVKVKGLHFSFSARYYKISGITHPTAWPVYTLSPVP